ncbi:methyl-accepting chemotaxis protein [Clostridium sp. MB40-C1]|uniref:methyl-accepting chemotaxis protein n=1 Tax=Clostridium sp. MB40-C1 TaxID=3070996 RepID=UPI0027E005D6|nr:methyl-accepting chemotaxis protein [Clostridium sp. MB40-C1]WMJ79287.1 methyl-accepting chemotaxis protein [Clostridium sp. MB40-C1]
MDNNVDAIIDYQRKTYKLVINIYILSITAAVLLFPTVKAFGLYPEVEWKYIIGFIVIGLLENILLGLTKNKISDREKTSDKKFSRVKTLVGLGCFVNYIYMSIMIPSKELWVCVFYFILLCAAFLDKKLIIESIGLGIVSQVLIFKMNPSALPSQDVLLREGIMRLVVISLICFGIYFFMYLSSDLLEKVDLKIKTEVEHNKKISNLFNRISEFSQTLLSSSENLTAVIEDEHSFIQEIASTSMEVNEDSNEMLAKTEKNREILEGLLNLNQTVSTKAKDTEKLSSDLIGIANENKGSLNKSLEIIDNIKVSIENTLNATKVLNEKSDQLDSIFKILADISDKTNLLALNASIEAARVGEAGKGFAVVATEIQKLSESTKQSLDEVGLITNELKGNVCKVENLMINNNGEIIEGNNILNSVFNSVEKMMLVLNTSVNDIKDINTSAEVLLTEVNSVVKFNANIYGTTKETINKFKNVTKKINENVNLIEEISVNTENLKDIASEMNKIIE